MTMTDDADAINEEIGHLIETDGDNCTICRKPLTDRAPIFYGKRLGQLVLTSNCCASKLDTIYSISTYLAADTPDEVDVSDAILRAHRKTI
jgi:hypothetical protein